jgi:uncharacterized protein (TIRG00374 family)
MSHPEAKPLITQKSYVNAAIKWLIAIVLLVLVFRSGKLSLEPLLALANKPGAFLICFLIIFLMALMTFIRWQWILTQLGCRLSTPKALRLGMIGQFFSTVIPGSVGGDLIKAVYVMRMGKGLKSIAMLSVALDRVLGLVGLIFLGALAFGYLELSGLSSTLAQNKTGLFVRSLGGVLIGSMVVFFIVLFFLPQLLKILDRLHRRSHKVKLLSRLSTPVMGALNKLSSKRLFLLGAVLMSTAMHALALVSYYIVARAIHAEAAWGTLALSGFIVACVLGNCSIAIPITPLGLGIGQIVYSSLFQAAGAVGPEFGAGLITNIQLVTLLIGLLGSLFFISYRHEVALSYDSTT